MITILEDEVYDAEFSTTDLLCAGCGRFFPLTKMTDGLCTECLESEEAAWATFIEIEEEPF